MGWEESYRRTVIPAVERSRAIDAMIVAENCLSDAGAIFQRHFGSAPALMVADETTSVIAGAAVRDALSAAGIDVTQHIIPAKPRLSPERGHGDEIAAALSKLAIAFSRRPIAVAVGSGVVHDLVRYAAFEAGTSFMSVPTAASMDGYASAGAPLLDRGFKMTIQCAPPRVILADLAVIAAAPPEMSAWGFGDLAGKMPAGGDWLVADALAIEPIDPAIWSLVQDNLRSWLSSPGGARRGDKGAIADLFIGLAVSGIAMELHGSSRPASGADHQIAHLWEMEDLAHAGQKASHGACVAIGCLTMLALFDWLIEQNVAALDADAIAARAPTWPATERAIRASFDQAPVADRAVAEARAKHPEPRALAGRLRTLVGSWDAMRRRLTAHLMPAGEMRSLLSAAGAPVTATEIGLSPDRHRATVLAARWIRKRYTVLDMLAETGLLERAVAECFGEDHWLYA